MNKSHFLLDANCFIEPRNTFYPFCYAPAFWDALLYGHESGVIFSLDEVKKEISEKEDEIKNWVEQENFPPSFFKPITEETIRKFAEIQNWTDKHRYFSRLEKNKFASKKTDGCLVAYAKEHHMVLVTQEKFVFDPKTTKSKIPNLCRQFGVEFSCCY
jgi:hypothetical protein